MLDGQPGGPVDELPDDVRLTGMPAGLGGYVDQDPVQRHLVPLGRPPRHMAEGLQPQRVDRGIGVRPRPAVQAGDEFA